MHLPRIRSLAAALLLAAAAGPALATTAHTPSAQVPGVYHQQIGTLQVTALFDGTVALGRQELAGIDAGAVTRLLDHRYVPEDGKGLQTAVNAYLVQRGNHLTLVDTGTATCFGPGLGQVLGNLRAAGYDPADVDDVLLTHAHPDHLCGLLDAQDTMAYPNATVWLSAADAAYWLDPASEATAPQGVRFAFALARKAVAPYAAAGKLRRFSPGQALPVGVAALDSHGHTPGHVSWKLDAGKGQAVLVWGDIVHFHAVQFAQPQAAYEADSDRTAAVASRRAMMAQAADGGWWVAGAHLPFPGLGHVRREGKAFAWVPGEFAPLPGR
ncbi:MBL fold metallo-hydrolase [Stenotrophomonas rhizophila]|uniref:MBL fold metallo-hydrolase n=1 Tax=Stenotrophomonas rhizophila TaxID=216778 RepID=UPI0028D26CCE|nr:MBL fold metallo-hydrolase [Stenotrophomonas rhizophila]